jgi:hypothetical protein
MEQLPPWLRNLPLPLRPPGFSDAPVATGADEEVPEWLRELQGEIASDTPAAPGDADWLADLRGSAQPSAAEPPATGGEADWLADLRGAAEQPSAERADEQQTSTTSRVKMPVGATDWLRSIGRDPDAKSEPLSEPLSAPLDESGVPDWLRDLSPDEVARGVESDVPDSQPRFDPEAPGWLVDDTPMADASTVADERADERPPVEETADAGDVPDWLRDVIAADEDEPRAEPLRGEGRLAGGGSGPQLAGGVDVPAWLQDLGDEPAPEAPARPGDSLDWLRGPALEADQPAAEPAGEEEDVPAWLREAEQAGAGEAPAWLRDAEQASRAPAEHAAADEDGPAWLREAGQAGGAPAERAGGAEEIPAWLREAEQVGGAPPSPTGGDEEIPAWLREAEPERGPEPEQAPADEEVPAWLREAEHDAPPAAEQQSPTWLRDALAERESEPGLATPPDDAAPAWLTEDAPAAPLPSAPQRPAADLPPWLAGEEAAGQGDAGATPHGDLALPSWLRGVADEPPATPPARGEPPPPPPRRPVPVAEEGDTSSGFMKGAELPSWLRVPEPELPGETVEGQQLDWLRRLGGSDQDEEGDSVAQIAPADRPQRRLYQRSPEQREAIALLQSLSRAPYPAPVALPAPAPRTALQRIGLDRVIYGLLALALILGLLVPQLTTPFQTPAPAAPGAAELGALLDGLGSEDVVLVAYEWAAQRSGELRPLEEAVLSRLIAEKTKLVLVSTDMQGTLLSFEVRDPLRAAGYNVEPDGREFGGRDYLLLGYRPGGELALRSLAQDLRGELTSDFSGQDATESLVANNADGTPRISSIRDLGLILVLADQPQDVQVWMEQVHRAAPEVPIAFLLPQEAEPLAQPYLRLPGVYHVAGQQGALALLGGDAAVDPSRVARVSGQHWYSVLVFVILLLLGGLGAALARAGARRSRGGAA